MTTSAEQVKAPGQEAFITPDVSKPVDDVSDSASNFDEAIDWEKALDGDDDENELQEVSSVQSPQPDEDVVTPVDDAAVEDTSSPVVSDEEAAAAVVRDEDDFQPQPLPNAAVEESTDENWEEKYTTYRSKAAEEIEKRYALTPEEADEFQLHPEKVLPKMVANAYVDVFESVLAAVNEMLPQRVGVINNQSILAAERTKQFYDAWPDLRTPEAEKKVLEFGQMYSMINKEKGYKPEEFIRDVGTQVSVAMGVPIPGVTDRSNEGGDSSNVVPYTPAAVDSSATPVEMTPRQPSNQFEVLNEEWEED